MRLNGRIARLERTLGNQPCSCDDNADLSWPGHHPHADCPSCGGQRLIYPLTHHPGKAEAQLRAVLPLLAKAYDGSKRAQLHRLADDELRKLRAALVAASAPAQ